MPAVKHTCTSIAHSDQRLTPSTQTSAPVIVFIAGGMTFSEARVIYQVSEKRNKNIYFGSTDYLTPDKFCADLLALKPKEDN